MTIQDAILKTMKAYAVRNHYVSTRERKRTVYSVFRGGERVTEPSSHADAVKARDDFIVRDIVLITAKSEGRLQRLRKRVEQAQKEWTGDGVNPYEGVLDEIDTLLNEAEPHVE